MGYLKDEKGYAIPLVMMLMFVLTLLGTALWQYATADALQVARDEKKAQAFYVARSGAYAVARYIRNNTPDADDLITAPKSDLIPLGEGHFSVEVSGNVNPEGMAKQLVIESTGEVGGVSQTMVLTMNNSGVFDGFVLFANLIDIEGKAAVIHGNVVFTDKEATESETKFLDEIIQEPFEPIHDPDLSYPPVDFPDLPDKPDLAISGGTAVTIDEPGEYEEISVHGNGTLNFELDGDLEIYAHTMTIMANSNIFLKGNGRLLLYVDSFTGGGNFSYEPDPDADVSLIIFVSKDGIFNMNGTPNFTGAVYAPEAMVNIVGNTTLQGSIIADQIDGGGKLTVIYKDVDTDDLALSAYREGSWQWGN